MNKPNLPTLEDVAKAAAVSTSTVSRCLNLPDKVSPKTRDKILKVVEELGYAPNFFAKAMAGKRTNTFGAIVPTLNNAVFAAGLEAFQNELAAQNVTLLLASSYYDQDEEEQQIRSLISKGADGLLLIGDQRDESIYRFIEQRQIPYVIAWSYCDALDKRDGSSKSNVGFDNYQASYELTIKALQLGHRNFSIISGHTLHNDRAANRLYGIKTALLEHGIILTNNQIVETSYSIDNGSQACEYLLSNSRLSTSNRPSIIMCGNDVLAVGAVKQAKSMNLIIPDDISITGFDDIELASVIEPRLTTVRVPHKEMGTLAAQALLRKINDATYRVNTKLPTSIVNGKSLAAPSALLVS